jgi:hypothetical protein
MSEADDEWLVHAKERRALKGEYKELFLAVSAILFRHNTIGLDFETNIDEYDPEVSPLLARLKTCHSAADVQTAAHEVFIMMFDAQIAGPRDLYAGIGADVWALWNTRSWKVDA